MSEEVLQRWRYSPKTGKPGRPQEYADTAILCALHLKAVFRLNFRATEGFLQSLAQLLKVDLKIPDYVTISKRQKHLKAYYLTVFGK